MVHTTVTVVNAIAASAVIAAASLTEIVIVITSVITTTFRSVSRAASNTAKNASSSRRYCVRPLRLHHRYVYEAPRRAVVIQFHLQTAPPSADLRSSTIVMLDPQSSGLLMTRRRVAQPPSSAEAARM